MNASVEVWISVQTESDSSESNVKVKAEDKEDGSESVRSDASKDAQSTAAPPPSKRAR